jgi:hypothetical protein
MTNFEREKKKSEDFIFFNLSSRFFFNSRSADFLVHLWRAGQHLDSFRHFPKTSILYWVEVDDVVGVQESDANETVGAIAVTLECLVYACHTHDVTTGVDVDVCDAHVGGQHRDPLVSLKVD